MEIADILQGFAHYDGVYKREHVDAALEQREQITPHLIDVLQRLLADPDAYLEDADDFGHIYAFMLLGYFGEPQAHDTLIDVFSLPDEIPSQLFGDLITEDLPMVLFRTCDGSLDKIRSLALNQQAYDYCRSAALGAMVYAAVDGVCSRTEVLEFFGSLFTGDEAAYDSSFWSSLASHACELYPEELMPVIKQAYEEELIFPGYIGLDNFQRTLASGQEVAFERVRADMRRRHPDDFHSLMSWWACFRSASSTSGSEVSLPSTASPKMQPSQPRKPRGRSKRRKRRMAKASRRRNR